MKDTFNVISDEYKALNKQLHYENRDFGDHGDKWRDFVDNIAQILNTTSILDYGCGKGALAKSLPHLPIREYDPCVPGKDAIPQPAHLVVCTDVLEHVEPELLDDVLEHLGLLMQKSIMLAIHCGPADKHLPDGRNAHLSQHGPQWWVEKINKRWIISQMQYVDPCLFVIARPKID